MKHGNPLQSGSLMTDIKAPVNPAHLTELINRYCGEAEERLSAASDYRTALRLKETLCARFQEECESSLVVNATRQYIDAVLRKRWGDSREDR